MKVLISLTVSVYSRLRTPGGEIDLGGGNVTRLLPVIIQSRKFPEGNFQFPGGEIPPGNMSRINTADDPDS